MLQDHSITSLAAIRRVTASSGEYRSVSFLSRDFLTAWRVVFAAICVLLLGAPLARATVSALAEVSPPTGEVECSSTSSAGDGGSGFTSASVPPTTCGYVFGFLFGQIVSTTGSASGSWVTGDLSASAGATGIPAAGAGIDISSFAADVFSVSGIVTVSSGSSAVIMFGATGVSGTATGGGVAGYSSSFNSIELEMIDGGSSSTSLACLSFDLLGVGDSCPLPYGGSGLGLGALAPVSLTVNNGDTLELDVTVEATAYVNAQTTTQTANGAIAVDPLYLTLPDGVTFDSGITGFLSGPPPGPPSSVPEPASFVLLGTGFIALGLVRRRKRKPA